MFGVYGFFVFLAFFAPPTHPAPLKMIVYDGWTDELGETTSILWDMTWHVLRSLSMSVT